MLKDFVKPVEPGEEELKKELKEAQEKLASYQMEIKNAKLPVIVIFEGCPRFFRVRTMASPTEEEKRYPFLHRYLLEIPEAGKFTFFDTYWMNEVVTQHMEGELDENQYKHRVRSINTAERSLTDNGYLVMNHISKKEQKKRLDDLMEDKNTRWRVNNDDLHENKHYKEYLDVYEQYLEDTDRAAAPWYIIDASNKKWAELQVLRFLNQGIDTALKNHSLAAPIRQNIFQLNPIPKLSEVSLDDKTISKEEYDKELDSLQKELRDLHNELYRKKIPVIIAYEGWDAAGKGGNIKRITSALDPRGYEVHPIASPEPHEKSRHFLWRFWNRLPKDGHIAVFDRTWYGRVMVERIEGFCSENDWQRAYNEINEFEKELADWGAVIIKFWVQIDKDTQLARFNDRQNTPEKQWKITDEDWRNREKWDQYESAIDEMLQKTNIKALKIVVEALKKACKEKE